MKNFGVKGWLGFGISVLAASLVAFFFFNKWAGVLIGLFCIGFAKLQENFEFQPKSYIVRKIKGLLQGNEKEHPHSDGNDESVTATALIFNDNQEILLIRHPRRDDKWLPPGSHLGDNSRIDKAAINSAERETGYKINLHPVHGARKNFVRGHTRAPCPFFVLEEKQFAGEGHTLHYDLCYICEEQGKVSAGEHPEEFFTLEKVQELLEDDRSYPDVPKLMKEAICLIEDHNTE